MREISLHLLDLMQNSLRAGARHIICDVRLDPDGRLAIDLKDDGCGMDEAMLKEALSPFGTTRTSRKVGLGIPLARANARLTGGDLSLRSQPDQGTALTLTFFTGHVDCLPLGDLAESLFTAVSAGARDSDFTINLISPQGEEAFDTLSLREALGPEIPLDEPEVSQYILQALREKCQAVFKGVLR